MRLEQGKRLSLDRPFLRGDGEFGAQPRKAIAELHVHLFNMHSDESDPRSIKLHRQSHEVRGHALKNRRREFDAHSLGTIVSPCGRQSRNEFRARHDFTLTRGFLKVF